MILYHCAELSDSFDWASYLMEGIEYPTYSDTDEVRFNKEGGNTGILQNRCLIKFVIIRLKTPPLLSN